MAEAGWFITGEHEPLLGRQGRLDDVEPLTPSRCPWLGRLGAHRPLQPHQPQQPRDHGTPTTVTGGVFGGSQTSCRSGSTGTRHQCPLPARLPLPDIDKFAANGVTHQGQHFQAVALRPRSIGRGYARRPRGLPDRHLDAAVARLGDAGRARHARVVGAVIVTSTTSEAMPPATSASRHDLGARERQARVSRIPAGRVGMADDAGYRLGPCLGCGDGGIEIGREAGSGQPAR